MLRSLRAILAPIRPSSAMVCRRASVIEKKAISAPEKKAESPMQIRTPIKSIFKSTGSDRAAWGNRKITCGRDRGGLYVGKKDQKMMRRVHKKANTSFNGRDLDLSVYNYSLKLAQGYGLWQSGS